MPIPNITVYGADWCGDCRRSKRFLDENKIAYLWINTDDNKEAEELVRYKNGGMRIIPTIIFADGSFLAEPSNEELAVKIGIVLEPIS
jgi:glutaredoxin-like protein